MKGSPPDAVCSGTVAECHGVPATEWRSLCDSARLLQHLAPWKWMEPSRMFGLSLSDSDQIVFISIMGGGENQNRAVFAFLGWEAFTHIRRRMADKNLTIRDLIETPALQVTFVDAEDAGDSDRAILECGGMGNPLPEIVPLFRIHRTGYLPWLLNADEVRTLRTILRQVAGVVMRAESEPELLAPPGPEQIPVFGTDAAGHWRGEWQPVPPASEFDSPVQIDAVKVAQVAALPPGNARIQFDLALSRATVGQAGQPLRTTYLMAAFDSRNGRCIGADVIMPIDGLATMWRSVPDRFLNLCLHAGSRPREIEVASEQMMETLRPLLGHLPFKLTLRLRLPHFQNFLEEMNTLTHSKEQEAQ